MAPNTARDHPDDRTSDNGGPTLQYTFPPYRGPQAQPHKRGILRIDRQVRFCKYCLNLGINLIEDEHHVLLICPLFNDIRQRYIAKHFKHFWPSVCKYDVK